MEIFIILTKYNNAGGVKKVPIANGDYLVSKNHPLSIVGWLLVWVLRHIKVFRLFNAKSIFSNNQFYFKQFSLA